MTQKIVNVSEIDKLLPCPFCGSEAYYSDNKNEHYGFDVHGVTCKECDVRNFESTKEDAINAWNNRALLDKSPSVSGEAVALQCGVSRAEWHDKAWALFHTKTFEDSMLHKVNMLTIRAVFDATYDALYTKPQPDRVAELEAKLKVASEALEKVLEHEDVIVIKALAKIKD